MNEAKTEVSRQQVEVSSLKTIAVYLEGVKQGKGGNLLPLGNNDLEQLWNAIALLKEDERLTKLKDGFKTETVKYKN